jgi:thioredoxin-like negative regulator of GroEL
MPSSSPQVNNDRKWIIGGMVILLFVLFARQSLIPVKADKRGIEPPADAFFETNIANEPGPLLVKFGAEWCGPCKSLDAALAAYSESKDSLKVVFVDTDHQPGLAAHYGVGGIPHSFLFKNGKVIDDRIGSMSIGQIKQWGASQKDL